ncbi:hypothetical protein B0187_04085 [Haemophilus paracuniculus]|uniref:Outer membrane protein n=1 Tax=Haemophilus paracuniculus TaxID=734 RepID=A0A1T0ATY5_9PAST|nr:hypothetical protein [Haemophilus paracuniculus]OOR99994.1 hypothetical protein B0187_04085 [Haemophilus paracuniculus]
MKIWKKLTACIAVLVASSAAFAEEFKIKYSSNYLMPAYVTFKNGNGQYSIKSQINVPLYNIVFTAKGLDRNNMLSMLSYRDTRNGKTYAVAEIDSKTVKYGRTKEPLKEEVMKMPTFDLFTTAFQLSYYDKLPNSFQTTNGKKLYPTENVVVNKTSKMVKRGGQNVEEITYRFRTGDKYITVKKHADEKFPRYISYNRDGDNYELKFDSFVK